MTHIYKTTGELRAPVQDVIVAQSYLREDDMTKYVPDALKPAVFHVQWNLTDASHWEVTVIANRALTDDEREALSEWISGQNSDGLGEGFEQQAFAECKWSGPANPLDDDDGEDYITASFDWATNKCTLEMVK